MASSKAQEPMPVDHKFPPSTDRNSDGNAHNNANVSDHVDAPVASAPRIWRFGMVFAFICLVSLSTSLDSTIIRTALPTITKSIGGEDKYV
ncbi:hypothetical protein MMC08_000341 [Hypocenomyce scalaris]|nr:hypothetical protein [Hypocenomyce scalaris]